MLLVYSVLLLAVASVFQIEARVAGMIDGEEAMDFFDEKRSLEVASRFFYNGPEQRREVREKYEEKCERSILHKSRPRWCPELDNWPEWQAASQGDPKPKPKFVPSLPSIKNPFKNMNGGK